MSIAAAIYFIVTARQPNDVPAMVSAGLAAALCALSREYGWIALIAGVDRAPVETAALKQVVVFAAVATAAAAPWYVRNWVLAGNPFYSLSFGDFAVNPIHAAILQHYKTLLGSQRWTAATWSSLLWFLLLFATFQLLAGIPGGFTRFRRDGYLMRHRAFAGRRLDSIGRLHQRRPLGIHSRLEPRDGRALHHRGRTPGAFVEPPRPWRTAIVAAILLCQIWTAAYGVLIPINPLSLSLSQWPRKRLPSTFRQTRNFKSAIS